MTIVCTIWIQPGYHFVFKCRHFVIYSKNGVGVQNDSSWKTANSLFVWGWDENPSLVITVCHHSASLVMPNGDPRDGFSIPSSQSWWIPIISRQLLILQAIADVTLTLKAPPIICSRRQFQILPLFFKKEIRHDISWELSAGRQFSWYIIPYFFWQLGKMLQNLSSAAVVIGALRVKCFYLE